ncbi:MAG: 50S ribosomal protein L1 [Candidatus Marinimicrobia bacterium]|nr:50S ribosomal protein L1 [Candidatus Neomarinimicrobiota bacterium]|tara:strand:- start:12075 stop:12764 length:690 start_codon:yes stop_codon:yes gene_type:complete
MKTSKSKRVAEEQIDRMSSYSLSEAVSLMKKASYAKFDESVDLSINLGVDPRHADQNIRVTTGLPNGTGKSVKILVITNESKFKEAEDAGADYVGNKEYLEKLKTGWGEVEKIVATPDMMGELGKLGKILGPKGLMPNPKSGTVTNEIGDAVKELKAGKVELRVEKTGIIHVSCGKVSFDADAIVENVKEIYSTIMKARPPAVKGQYFKKMTISSTMGPGIKVDYSSIR